MTTELPDTSPAPTAEGSRPDVWRRALAEFLGTVNRPSVIIADEPTGQLDSTNAEAMMRLLTDLVHREQVAAIVSTHDARMAGMADRVLASRDGALV